LFHGLVLLACTVLYLIPRSAVLGAILLTGYLGGAVATHVLVSAGLFEILFPVIFGASSLVCCSGVGFSCAIRNSEELSR
jgi:hypothetical protein